jgi:CRISPR-associated endonuclease Csn1
MPETAPSTRPYVLGIDLGSASIGWAVVELDTSGAPTGLLSDHGNDSPGLPSCGVRIFEPAVSGDIEKGQDESNAVARRAARLVRRQLRRRVARQRELFRLLQQHGLLPLYCGTDGDGSRQRHAVLNELDREIVAKWAETGNGTERIAAELPLYMLRKAALDEALTPFEMGRVFYHLSQRRGYKSNRKEKAVKSDAAARAAKKDDLGQVEGDIQHLAAEMNRAGARTLGEYFASLNPHEQRVRRRWTGRKMYEDEFAEVWERQAAFHPGLLTEELRREIKRLLFYQRPIREQAHLIGGCELEPGERRAAWATLDAQQFRILQKVNDLELVLPGQVAGIPLTPDQRLVVLNLLENSIEVTFKKIRKALNLGDNVGFNLQRGGETKLKGNLTNTHMADVFAERWPEMSDEERRQVVEDWRTIPQDDSLIRRATHFWKLDEPGAKWLASRSAPSGYCMYSREAIRKLLPLMTNGMRLNAAVKEIYGERLSGDRVYDSIPPVRSALKSLRNPAIERALTELRKVVNAVVRRCGKPAEIRIELARDLKRPRKERAGFVKVIRDREKERNAAKEKLLKECGIHNPSRADVEKALLWEECGGICPYTGQAINFGSLFGQNPQFDVEHIIPFSRIPDDSFQNKTLCYHEENRNVKRNQTPFEAYRDPDQYQAICDRLRSWPKPNLGKLRRFELRTTDELEGFSSRQLNDTRYASKLAGELVGTLYGGRDVQTDSGSRQVIFASSGMVTATLRRGWGLEAILREAAPSSNGLNKGKPRTDHRHHAIDAIVIALSRPSMIAALARSNAQDSYWPQNGRTAPKICAPWKDFVASIRPHFERMFISHRPEHRLTGELHDATNYGRPRTEGGKSIVHIRKTVPGLSSADIENIVDDAVRGAVRTKAAAYGGDLKKWTPREDQNDWPMLQARNGQQIPIKRVRIKKTLAVETIAKGTERERQVATNSVHHVAVFVTKDRKGRDKWISDIVTVFEAACRLEEERRQRKAQPGRKPKPLVYGVHSEDKEAEFLFFLMKKDTIRITVGGQRRVYLVTSFETDGRISLIPINAAGKRSEQKGPKETESTLMIRESLSALKERCPEKVSIDPLGRVTVVRDEVRKSL